ncbi:MAG: N-acetylmuramoyl-L-alanine amidase [Donghicola eburneus]|nr:N-acetylmuramoyl-L-alanine amidase [Donghicola eburneus]MCI5038438.1 N-acetylmuramoyl-L-alanine amidase [Donghicola eburneus]
MRTITEIIVHCAAVPSDWRIDKPVEAQVAEIRRWHLARGWSDIGYHAVGHQDGSIGLGRDRDHDGDIWEEIGAHVAGHNRTTLGYCLIGGAGSKADDQFEDHFTEAQDKALRRWIADRLEQFPTIKKISGHNQYARKACPGFFVPDWWAREPVSRPAASQFDDVVNRMQAASDLNRAARVQLFKASEMSDAALHDLSRIDVA